MVKEDSVRVRCTGDQGTLCAWLLVHLDGAVRLRIQAARFCSSGLVGRNQLSVIVMNESRTWLIRCRLKGRRGKEERGEV